MTHDRCVADTGGLETLLEVFSLLVAVLAIYVNTVTFNISVNNKRAPEVTVITIPGIFFGDKRLARNALNGLETALQFTSEGCARRKRSMKTCAGLLHS